MNFSAPTRLTWGQIAPMGGAAAIGDEEVLAGTVVGTWLASSPADRYATPLSPRQLPYVYDQHSRRQYGAPSPFTRRY